MATYSESSVLTLQEYATGRNLECSRTKEDLIQRLRDDDWNSWLCLNKTFDRFRFLPPEIQDEIWRFSLPGPRMLAMDLGAAREDYFPKKHHTPNPAALSACRASRRVALERYRLVFDTQNVYANLEGGDILYIGAWNGHMRQTKMVNCIWDRDSCLASRFAPSKPAWFPSERIFADLETVTHVSFHLHLARSYRYMYSKRDRRENTPPPFRAHLANFKALKMVSICYGGTDFYSHHYPGQVVIDLNPSDGDTALRWGSEKAQCLDLIRWFHSCPTEEEIKRGMPAIQTVHVNRIPDPTLTSEEIYYPLNHYSSRYTIEKVLEPQNAPKPVELLSDDSNC